MNFEWPSNHIFAFNRGYFYERIFAASESVGLKTILDTTYMRLELKIQAEFRSSLGRRLEAE